MPPKIEEIAEWIIEIVEKKHTIPDDEFTLFYSTDHHFLQVQIYGREILRIKMTDRACWFKIDMYDQFDGNYENPLFDSVKNKRSTMWQVQLPFPDKFYEYEPYIMHAANVAVDTFKEATP